MSGWYSRTVFFVNDIEIAHKFYIEDMEFTEAWKHTEDGRVLVAQVSKHDCEIILARDPERAGKSRIFIALDDNELVALRTHIEKRALAFSDVWWGSPIIEIRDPDGNELYFSYDE